MTSKSDNQRIKFIKILSNARGYYSSIVQLSVKMSRREWNKMMNQTIYYRYKYWFYTHCGTKINDADGYSTIGFCCANCNKEVIRKRIKMSAVKMIACPECGAMNDVYQLPTAIFKPAMRLICWMLSHFGVKIARLKYKLR